VHLKVASNWDTKPIYDVIATLRGTDDSQWVIRGNHHDAWVNGADDPISGQAPMLEEARVLGELHRQGWNPKRTIIYCAWDGEEPGLLGSVEWVETHVSELKQHTVAYINSDSNGRGFFHPGGTQDLESFISSVARDVTDPETHSSVFQRAHLLGISRAKNADERATRRKRSDLQVHALGDGSDYTAFQDFAGIPSLNLGFGGEDEGTQYHSIYDDFYWYTHFADTDFAYGRALAQTAGTAIMRLADADLLPFSYTPQSEAIANYEKELERLLKDKQDEFTELKLELEEGVFAATADPRKPIQPPAAEAVPPYMSFARMKNALEIFKASSERYAKAQKSWEAQGSPSLTAQSLNRVNSDLLEISRRFLNERGLPERPWFKNQIYAPGAYTGYDARPIAAVREYMDEKKWEKADAEIPQVSEAIERAAKGIGKAADALEAAVKAVR
jgi:N-acetylated-alpha-linked acidic dipeptidase